MNYSTDHTARSKRAGARWVPFGRSADPCAPRLRPISFQFYQLHLSDDGDCTPTIRFGERSPADVNTISGEVVGAGRPTYYKILGTLSDKLGADSARLCGVRRRSQIALGELLYSPAPLHSPASLVGRRNGVRTASLECPLDPKQSQVSCTLCQKTSGTYLGACTLYLHMISSIPLSVLLFFRCFITYKAWKTLRD